MKNLIHKAAIAATLGTMMMGGAFAQTMATLPPLHKSGQVEYLSGGIGKDEATAIERASKQWPLTLEFAVKEKEHAAFVANVSLVVRDAKGHTALQTTSDGPLLLARLAPGHYTIDATLADKTLHRQVSINPAHPAKIVLIWPTGTGESRS